MNSIEDLTRELAETLPSELNIEIPCPETDLFEEGILDSLGLIDLLLLMERRWGVTVSLDQLEMDNFRTLSRIAAFIERSRQPS